jgi:heat shock protein HspQ
MTVQSMDKRPEPKVAKSQGLNVMIKTHAKYNLGQVVRHKKHPFRGVVFDIDAEFSNSEEWYDAIPEGARPRKGQPFYHLLAENDHTYYVAYVSEQNLIPDDTGACGPPGCGRPFRRVFRRPLPSGIPAQLIPAELLRPQ